MKYYLAYYKPTVPFIGKRGRALKWHPTKIEIHAVDDMHALSQAKLRTMDNTVLGKLEQCWRDGNNVWRTRRVHF